MKTCVNEKEYVFYSPCNLNIFVSNSCHNCCKFCINRHEKEDLTTEQYLASLEKILPELSNIPMEVTITGGEPTIDKERFVKTLEILDKYNIPCRTVSTTGYNLLAEYNGKALAEYLIEYGYIHNISISRMAYDEELNNKLMQGQNISNKELKRVLTFFKLNGAEARISCNLMPDGINSLARMLKFVEQQNNLGADCILFREIEGDCPKTELSKIIQEIKQDNSFSYIETLNGMFYNVDVYKYDCTSLQKSFLVKYYKTAAPQNKDIIPSMSINHGKLRTGFSGHILL